MKNINVKRCIQEVAASLSQEGDADYFASHTSRYEHCIQSVASVAEPAARILDVGSHYLHQAAAFRALGHEVHALDVPEFAGLPFVTERAKQFRIHQHECANLVHGEFLRFLPDNYFQVVLFCEILEHITFNPIAFWHRIYQLMVPGGIIYISTPNSMQFVNMVSAVKRIIMGDGIGISLSAIFDTVTYGHHWKEYSKKEIVNYFATLSPDFEVQTTGYTYRKHPNRQMNFKSSVRNLVRVLGNKSGLGAEEIKAIVRLPQKTCWSAVPKQYGD